MKQFIPELWSGLPGEGGDVGAGTAGGPAGASIVDELDNNYVYNNTLSYDNLVRGRVSAGWCMFPTHSLTDTDTSTQ